LPSDARTRPRISKQVRDERAMQFVGVAQAAGGLNPALLTEWAEIVGCSERHLRRIYANQGPFSRRRGLVADEAMVDAWLQEGCNVNALSERLSRESGESAQSRWTYQRALRRSLGTAGLVELAKGIDASRRVKVSAPRSKAVVDGLFEMDFKDLRCPLRGPDGDVLKTEEGRQIHPKVLVLIHAGSGAVVETALTLRPSVELVIGLLIVAFCGLGEDPTFAGSPPKMLAHLRGDNDPLFLSRTTGIPQV
jgi:hypothetical protein